MRGKRVGIYVILILSFQLLSCQRSEQTEGLQEDSPKSEKITDINPEAKLEQIRSDLKPIKAQLAQEGKYNCCVQPTCDWCALHEGECNCYDNLKAGKPVCPGCGLGWHNGNGVVPGIKASEVKWDITHKHEHASGSHAH